MAVLPSGSTPFGALRPRSPSRWGRRLLPFLARWDALALPVASVSKTVSKKRANFLRIDLRCKKSDQKSDQKLAAGPAEIGYTIGYTIRYTIGCTIGYTAPGKLDTQLRKIGYTVPRIGYALRQNWVPTYIQLSAPFCGEVAASRHSYA